ncbi:MAG: hypothetical protein JXA61_05795 [Bacteroidales bacterium]|nr:hypothetical protein [Bacteroidales bacterium]
MKKLLNILFLVFMSSYFIVICGFINTREQNASIQSFQVHIRDSLAYQFLGAEDVINMLNRNDLNPVDKSLKEIRLRDIEEHLRKHKIIKDAEAYVTEPGVLHLDIWQKNPFIRIINGADQGYYLDREGNIIPLSDNFSPFVLVASGFIREPFTISRTVNIFEIKHDSLPSNRRVLYDLFDLAAFIDGDDFWKSQIEQIFVNKNYDFELVPRVGPHIIEFGKAENIGQKFENLRLLYLQGLNNVGWNQYIRINVKYKNQVVCTKI